MPSPAVEAELAEKMRKLNKEDNPPVHVFWSVRYPKLQQTPDIH